MSFWNKASELAAERLKQGREQIASFQRQSSTPPRPSGRSSDPASDVLARTPERTRSDTDSHAGEDERNGSAYPQSSSPSHQATELARMQQANKLLEAKIEMLRANLQAARTHADASGGDDDAELQKLKTDLSKATRQISELEETAALFKDQQSASVQAAATLQAELKESAAALANTKSELAELTAANTAFKAELQSLQESGNEGKEPASTEPSIQSQDLQADLSALKQELTAAKQKLESQDRKLKASSADVERLRAAAAELERSNDSLQAEVAKTRAQNGTQISEIEKLTQLASSLQQKQIEASGKVADEDTRPVIAKLEGQNASLHAQLSEQKNVLGQQSARSSSEQKADSKRVSPEGSVESGARSPESLAGTQQLRKQASDLEKENSLLRKQLSLLEGNGTDTRTARQIFRDPSKQAMRGNSIPQSSTSQIRKTIMELERASRARESADILLNGGSLPARVESLRSDSPQTPSSPKIGPLKSMTSAPQPGESLEDASQKEASLMAEEVKRLRSQLQSATEKWARDKQMFAEDARELQRVSRARDQLASQVSQLQRAEAQRKDGNVELKEAREEIARKDAEISLAQDQSRDLKEMQDLLEGWDTGSGKVESNGDSGSILQQLSYRKAAMFALAKQAEAASQAASRNGKELKHSQAMIKELKAQLSKDRKVEKQQLQESTSEAESLKAQLQQQQAEASSLTARLQGLETLEQKQMALEEQHRASLEALSKAEAEKAEAEEARKKLADDLKTAKVQAEQKEDEVQSLSSQIAQLQNRCQEQDKQLQSIKSQHEQEKQKSQGLKTALLEAAEKHKQELQTALKGSKEATLKDLQGVEQRLSSALQEIAALQEAGSQRSRDLERRQAKLNAAEVKASEAEKQTEDLQQEIRKLTSEISSMEQRFTQATQAAEEARAEVRQHEAAAVDAERGNKQSAAQEVQKLQDEIAALQDKVNTAEAVRDSLSRAEADRRQIEEEYRQLSEQVAVLESQLKDVESGNDQKQTEEFLTVQKKLSEAQRDASEAQTQAASKEEQLMQLQSEASTLRNRADELQNELQRQQSRLQEAVAARNDAEAKSEGLQNTLSELGEAQSSGNEAERAKIAGLVEERARYQAANEDLKGTIKELEGFAVELEAEMHRVRQESQADKTARQTLSAQNHELQHQLQSSFDGISSSREAAEKEVAQHLEEMQSTKTSLEESQGLVEKQRSQLQELHGKVEQLEADAAASGELLQTEKETVQSLRAEIQALEGQGSSVSAEQAKEREGELVNLRAEASEGARKLQEYEQELQSHKKASESTSAEAEKLRSQLEAAQAQVEKRQDHEKELEAQASTASKEARQAAERSGHLEQEKQLLQEQIQKLDESWQKERASLKDKLERLQKANRQRRQEAEETGKQLASAQEMAGKGQQAREEVMGMRQEIDRLSSALSVAEQSASDSQRLKEEMKRLEAQHVASLTHLRKEAAAVQSGFAATERERDQLLQETTLLKSASVAKDALQSQVAMLSRDLEAAKEGLEQKYRDQQKADELEKLLRQVQSEAARTSQLLAQAQRKQQQFEQEARSASGMLAEEQKQRVADSKAFAAELESLASRDTSAWPSSLRAHFQQHAKSAADAAAAGVQVQAEAHEEALEAELASARQEAQQALALQRHLDTQRDAAESRVQNLEAELQERESAFDVNLREQLEKGQAASDARCQGLEERLLDLEKALEASTEQASRTEAAYQAATKEVGEVKQRARALLEEKDTQLQAARTRGGFSRAASLSGEMLYTLPSNRSMTSDGHGGDQPLSRAASGQLPPTTPVSPTASEIEPAAEVPGAKTPPRRTRLQAMQERIDLLEKELSESEHTHKLRDRAQEVAKAEIAELGRRQAREDIDLEYLKAVLLKGFESGELSSKSAMLPVISRLLHFSPAELKLAQNPRKLVKGSTRK